MHLCADAEDFLEEHDELPGDSLPGRLHTEIADPIERLGAISESMNAQKEMQKAVPAELQMDMLGFVPAWAIRLTGWE